MSGEAESPVVVPEPGKVAIRDLDGSVSLVRQADLPAAQGEGARPATEAEYFGAKHGAAGDVAAGVVGAARGATFGLSDPLILGAASALGPAGEEEYRRTMRLLRETSPNASLGGELAGAGAMALATGGATGGLRLGTGALARLGAGAIEGAGIGAASGAGAQLTEDTLENHKSTAEAYLSAGLKGGAVGLLLGGAGAGVGLLGRGARAASRVEAAEGTRVGASLGAEEGVAVGGRKSLAERAAGLRDELTYDALGATRKDVSRLGGTVEEQIAEKQRLGRVIGELTDETGRPIVHPTASQAEIDRALVAKRNEIGASLPGLYKEADKAFQGPSMHAIREGMDGIRAKYTGAFAEEELGAAERAFTKLERGLGKNPTHTELWEASKKLGKLDADALGAPALRELRDVVKGELAASADRAGTELGGTLGDRLRLANQLYADLKTATKASSAAASRGGDAITLKEIALAGPALMAGHPAAALAGVALDVARRKYGKQIAAHALDTALRMDTFQRAATKLDQIIDSGTRAFASNKTIATRAPASVTTAEVRAIREATRNPEAVTARVAEHLQGMPGVAPKAAQEITATAARAAAWLQHALPREQAPISPLFGKPRETPLSKEDLLSARATIETVADGSVVVDRLLEGRLTSEHVAALRFVHPETFLKVQSYLAKHSAELNESLSQQQLTRLGILFGEPLTEQDLPENVRAFQASFVQGNQAPGLGGSGGSVRMNSKPVVGGGTSATQNDKIAAGG